MPRMSLTVPVLNISGEASQIAVRMAASMVACTRFAPKHALARCSLSCDFSMYSYGPT